MAVNSCEEEQDVYCISVLPDEGTTNLPCEPQSAFSSFVEVPNLLNGQMCMDVQCQKCINFQMESADAYSSCIVDIDIEKENLEASKTNDEIAGALNFEGSFSQLQRAFRKQISFQIGGKLLQLLINHSLMLPKFTAKDKPVTESVHDTPNNRWRKYKRAASFDSRKVVLLFSALSSMGTMVLIYLTLRVRQAADGFVHL